MPRRYRNKTLYTLAPRPRTADAPARMNVEVFLTSANVKESDVRGRTVVVIDVLRACSTIVTALYNGARSVIPVPDMAQAGRIASNMDPAIFLLGGERNGEKIEGYHLGNSPLEYTRDEVEDKTVIMNTTNGTVALERAKAGEHVVVGCFLNAARIVDFIREAGLDLTIVCAGWRDRVSLEDTMCAGLLLSLLWDGDEPASVSDTAHIAFAQYVHDQDHLHETLARCNHVQRLHRLGYDADVEYCLQVDRLPVLPYFTDSRLVLKKESSSVTRDA